MSSAGPRAPWPDWVVDGAHRVSRLDSLGMSERERDSALWEVPFRGVRRWASGSVDTRTVIASAAALLPEGCALGGWAAVYQHGVTYVDGNVGFANQLPVLLLVTPGHQLRQRPGIRPVRTTLADEDIVAHSGIATAVLDLAATQQMCLAHGLVEAVGVADMVTSRRTHQPTISMATLAARIDRTHKTRGIVQARTALSLADDRSASPAETRTRMVWVLDAGLPPPLVNRPIFDLEGRLLGYPDLLDAEAGYVHEVDGGEHREIVQHTADNIREEGFEGVNLTVSRSTQLDLRDRWALSRRMIANRRRGLNRDKRKDRWTLTPPPGWRPPPWL